jgi:mono/diheme cytochrome c family protein
VKPADQWAARLLTVTILCGGIAMAVERSPALALDGALPASDEKDAGGKAPTHPAGESAQGEKLYNASCVVCHGSRATGGVGPRLAGNPVLSNEQAFWKIVYEGRHVMPPLKRAVSEQQMADIKAWLKTLR